MDKTPKITSFTQPIKVCLEDNGKLCTTLETLVYIRKGKDYTGKNEIADRITIPEGFVNDGISGYILPRFGRGLKCAVLHDYVCYLNEIGALRKRKEADKIFLEAMLEVKAFWKIKCYIIYFAVRCYSYWLAVKATCKKWWKSLKNLFKKKK